MSCDVFACAIGAAGVVCASGVAVGGLPPAFDNTVDTFGVVKTGHYVQVDASTVGTQSYDFLAGFIEQMPADHNVMVADFRYENQAMTPNSVGMLEVVPGAWEWDDPTMFGNESAMDFTYTSANDYTFALTIDGMGVFEEAIDGPSDLYPDVVPQVSNYNALQMVDPTGAMPVAFGGFGNVGAMNTVDVRIEPVMSNTVVWGGSGLNTDSSIVIPGGVLDPSTSYDLFLTYRTFQDYDGLTTVFPDAAAAYTFQYETKVSLATTDVPAPGVGVVGLVGLVLVRRRRRGGDIATP